MASHEPRQTPSCPSTLGIRTCIIANPYALPQQSATPTPPTSRAPHGQTTVASIGLGDSSAIAGGVPADLWLKLEAGK